MAAIVWNDVSNFAPELASFNASAQTDVLTYVNTEAFDVSVFGDETTQRLRLCRIYLAAHIAKVATTGISVAAGPTTEERVGELTRSYGMLSRSRNSLLAATPYGRALMEMIDRSPARAPMLL